MVLGGAMAVMLRPRALAVQAPSAAGVQCSLAAAWRQALLLLNELRHQQLSNTAVRAKRTSVRSAQTR